MQTGVNGLVHKPAPRFGQIDEILRSKEGRGIAIGHTSSCKDIEYDYKWHAKEKIAEILISISGGKNEKCTITPQEIRRYLWFTRTGIAICGNTLNVNINPAKAEECDDIFIRRDLKNEIDKDIMHLGKTIFSQFAKGYPTQSV